MNLRFVFLNRKVEQINICIIKLQHTLCNFASNKNNLCFFFHKPSELSRYFSEGLKGGWGLGGNKSVGKRKGKAEIPFSNIPFQI